MRIASSVWILIVGAAASGCGKGVPSADELRQESAVGLKFQFPATPEKFEVPIPANVRSMVVSLENYRYRARNFEAGVSKATYVPSVQASADGAVDGCLANIAATEAMTRGTTDKKPVQIGDCEGIRYTATFRKGDKDLESQGIVLTKGPMLWQIFVIYLKDSATSRGTATKIVDSIELAP